MLFTYLYHGDLYTVAKVTCILDQPTLKGVLTLIVQTLFMTLNLILMEITYWRINACGYWG